MKQITIIIPCWGRYDIFNIIAKQLDDVRKKVSDRYVINVMVCLSLEDLEKQMLLDTVRFYNFGFCTWVNEPLGAKHNHIIKSAFDSFPDTDYIMNLGSDDLLHESIFDIYKDYIDKEVKYFGLDSCYFYNKITDETILYRYVYRDYVIGAGRMLHRSIFNKLPKIYNDEINSALDGNSACNITKAGFQRTKIVASGFPYVVDIKSSININSFQKIISVAKQNCTFVDSKIITDTYNIKHKRKIKVDSCNVEFGYELISAVPYAYYLNEIGMLKETVSAKGSESLYYFSPKHTINKDQRKYDNIKKAANKAVPNTFIHRHFLDYSQFKTPDYKNQFANNEYKYDKPIVCICNRYNNEWGNSPINFFSIDCLDKLFTLLKDYQVIYWAVDLPEVLQDGVKPIKLNDREFIKDKHPEVLIFQDLLKAKDWNTEQMKVFANCSKFITMNGGYSILASMFGGQNIIYSKSGQKQTREISIGSFQRWYPEFNNSQIKYVENYSQLYESVKMLYVDNIPTVNILIRTCQRPNFLKSCIESIEKQDYKNINIIIGVETEDTETLKYVIKYKYRVTFYNQIRKEPERPSTGKEYGLYFPFNHYLDEMNKRVDNGYIMYLDDDDTLIDHRAISKIISNVTTDNDIIFWRCKFGSRIIPSNENYGKSPVCCDISGVGILFNKKFINDIEWGYWKRGDFRVANKLYNKGNAKFINEVLTGIQTEAHGGKIVDKKKENINGQSVTNHIVRYESCHRKFGAVGSESVMEKYLAEVLEKQGYIKIL